MTDDIKKRLNQNIDSRLKTLKQKDQPAEELEPLDVRIETGLDQKAREITLIMTTGGPHIEIDLLSGTIKGFWSSEKQFYSIEMASEETKESFNNLKNYWIEMVEARGFEL